MSGVKYRRRSSIRAVAGLQITPARPTRSPDSEDDSENSSCPSPLLQVDGGYRIDPFTVYPIRATNGVRLMADYYIQIWAPQQVQAFSLGQSKNVLLSLVLPVALQDPMLFHATIGMTRAAWLLRKGAEPSDDKSLLKHRGMALKQLRGVLMTPHVQSSDALLLTMSTLLTMNYILNEIEPFQVHLQALTKMLENFSTSSKQNEVIDFIKGRVMAFDALFSFMHAHQPRYASRVNEPGHRVSTLNYPRHPFQPELCTTISSIPNGFAELALSKLLSIELISFLSRLTHTMNDLPLSTSARKRPFTASPSNPHPPNRTTMTMQRAIYDLQCLLALPLTVFEAQLAHALVAFCFQLYNAQANFCTQTPPPTPSASTTTSHSYTNCNSYSHSPEESTLPPPPSHTVSFARPLRTVTSAFNAPHAVASLPRARWQRRCLLWCAIVIAGAWEDTCNDEEVIAGNEWRNAVLEGLVQGWGYCTGAEIENEIRKWENVEVVMRGFLWCEELKSQWKAAWERFIGQARIPLSQAGFPMSHGRSEDFCAR